MPGMHYKRNVTHINIIGEWVGEVLDLGGANLPSMQCSVLTHSSCRTPRLLSCCSKYYAAVLCPSPPIFADCNDFFVSSSFMWLPLKKILLILHPKSISLENLFPLFLSFRSIVTVNFWGDLQRVTAQLHYLLKEKILHVEFFFFQTLWRLSGFNT